MSDNVTSPNGSLMMFHTPQSHMSSHSDYERGMDSDDETMETLGRKRKPEGSPTVDHEEDDDKTEFLAVMKNMFENIEKMSRAIVETRYTKAEIKLDIEKINLSMKEIKEKDYLSKIDIRDSRRIISKTKRQQTVCYKCHDQMKKDEEEKSSKLVREKMEILKQGKGNIQLVQELIEEDWPEDMYTKTVVKVGNPLVPNQLADTVLFLKNKDSKAGIIDTAKVIHPKLEEVLNNELIPGETCYVENIANTKKGTGGRKRLYLMGGEKVEDLVNSIKELVSDLQETESKHFAVAVVEEDRREVIRKMTEIGFSLLDVKIEFFVPSSPKEKNKKSGIQSKDTEVLIIKPSSTSNISYADMTKKLREVEKNVFPETMGVNITNVKKYKEDSLMITTKKGGAEILKTEIISSHGDQLTINIPKEDRTLMIIGIDALAEESDIEYGLMKALGVESKTNIEIKSVKLARNGTQMSEITVSAEYSIKLLELKKIKIGWTLCSVEKKFHIPRCYNCLRMGHLAKNCASEKEEGQKCFNCMEQGHTTQNCQNRSFCPQCNKGGHRPDTMACPLFRKRRKQGGRSN
ncbi:hypothetical protein M8J77_024851 [Diaphorina citri]|nr:hypothetical protein M8J77_024851 [Diaphorina citri]